MPLDRFWRGRWRCWPGSIWTGSSTLADLAEFLHVATTLRQLNGDHELAQEARSAATRILSRRPTQTMRERFQSAQPVRALGLVHGLK